MKLVTFKPYYGKQTRVAYASDTIPRKFISARSVPRRKLEKLIRELSAKRTPEARLEWMRRNLGYKSGKYYDEILVELMHKKIASMGQAAKNEFRARLRDPGHYRSEPQQQRNTSPAAFVIDKFWKMRFWVEKELEEANDWEDWMRASVREEIRKIGKWANDAAEKLAKRSS